MIQVTIDGRETPPCPDPLNPDTDQDGIIDGSNNWAA
jgi:hypothetical protein